MRLCIFFFFFFGTISIINNNIFLQPIRPSTRGRKSNWQQASDRASEFRSVYRGLKKSVHFGRHSHGTSRFISSVQQSRSRQPESLVRPSRFVGSSNRISLLPFDQHLRFPFDDEDDVSYFDASISAFCMRQIALYVEFQSVVSPHPAGIILTRPGYYTIPSLEELATMIDDDGRCKVSDFIIGRTGECSALLSSR